MSEEELLFTDPGLSKVNAFLKDLSVLMNKHQVASIVSFRDSDQISIIVEGGCKYWVEFEHKLGVNGDENFFIVQVPYRLDCKQQEAHE